ncbi:hypothetical protein DID78_02820 [Candidatus Marinamargulisbacteria bacterium SCGC AG-343-D04]|nr:hypothetical protein DID78_02820 [Candidatus Marinamargulisbacteria bacterium SCGC AG-343-D04]
MMSVYRRFFMSLLTFLFTCFACVCLADVTPQSISFEVVLSTQQTGRLQGEKNVQIFIGPQETVEDRPLWRYSFDKVSFVDGRASFILGWDGNPLKEEVLSNPNTVIFLEVDGLTTYFPISSVPYAIHADTAEYVDEVDASTIRGVFGTTLNIQADVHVVDDVGDTVFFVDHSSGKIGIATSNPNFDLDVNGRLNASEYFIDGESLESVFSWTRRGNILSYNSDDPINAPVRVGIGTDNPDATLEVIGTINANEYFVKGIELGKYYEDILVWKDDGEGNIFYSSDDKYSKIGIGLSENISERLEVSGSIRLSYSIQPRPRPGTIEFNSVLNDFIGYGFSDQSFSLTGVQVDEDVSISPGELAFWLDDRTITSTDNFVFKDGKLAVGTDNPTALLTIHGDGTKPFLDVKNKSGSVFFIDSTGNIGVHKSDPQFSLDILGVVDASSYLVSGEPLQSVFSTGTFWNLGNSDEHGTDLFYEHGNVGIGTQDPVNLLEIASLGEDVAITFDIDGTDLFSMGVKENLQDSFIISQGNDLEDPIFVFKDNVIGVGTDDPRATLHVSGNSGFLVEGGFDESSIINPTGNTSQLLFFPGKSVLRVGRFTGNQWKNDRLGIYSSAFGLDNVASGEYSFVGGGKSNVASGNYAFISGGLGNLAQGDYSFAGGYYAKALHDGTFVWADSTPTANFFKSTRPYQFLVRAFGGVGLNTNETAGSTFVVNRKSDGKILNLFSTADTSSPFVVNADGSVGINTLDTGESTLAVEGTVGIGTTEPKGVLHIKGDPQSSDYLMYVETVNFGTSVTPSVFVVTSTGNVGIGTDIPAGKLDVNGKIFSTGFVTVDPNDPNKLVQLQPNPGSPWLQNDAKTLTYYVSGKVGIGTATPNTLLELSNLNAQGNMPVIGYDLEGRGQFKSGLIRDSDNGVYFAVASSENFTEELAMFVVTQNSVVIGRGVTQSAFALDVSGDVVIDGKLSIGTTTIPTGYDVLVDGKLVVTTLNINGNDFKLRNSSWQNLPNSDPTILYLDPNVKVGIGTQAPQSALDVNGIVSVNVLFDATDSLTLGENADLNVDVLHLRDVGYSGSPPTFGRVLLNAAQSLTYISPGGDNIVISSPLQIAQDDGSGPLAFWATDTSIGVLPIFWNNETKVLSATSNVVFDNFLETSDGLVVSSSVQFRDDVGFVLNSTIDHKGDLGTIEDYTLAKMTMSINEDWGKQSEKVFIKGIDLSLVSDDESAQFLNNATAIGLYVDVTSINISAGENASKYAAIFQGGNVGIGVEDPAVALEVSGVVSANNFNLSGPLSVPQLTVDPDNYTLHVELNGVEAFVGIGTSSPQSSLDVHGEVSANNFIIRDELRATSMNIGANNNFVIDENGNIGIGTDAPEASFNIEKILSTAMTDPFIAEKINVEIDGVDREGQEFYFSQDVTGLKLSLETKENSFIKNNTVKGLEIDFSTLNVKSGGTVYGVYVDVGEDEFVSNRYAAIFDGGFVGIGLTNPEASLHVSGDIKVEGRLVLDGNLETSILTVNNLVVNRVASMNRVTINNLVVLDSVSVNRIIVEQMISADEAEFDGLEVQTITVNKMIARGISVNTGIKSQKISVLDSFSVGTSDFIPGAFYVSGNSQLDGGVFVQGEVSANVLNVNNNFVVSENGYVGIGTTDPKSFLHMISDSTDAFDISDINTWNAMKLGVTGDRANQTVGMIFSPQDTPSKSIGSAILAQSGSEGSSSSRLIFVTDPENALPRESMVISSEGFVGINNSNPNVELDVEGNGVFTGSVTVNGTLSVSDIQSSSRLTINARESINFENSVEFKDSVILSSSLAFTPTDPSVSMEDSSYGYLYMHTDNDLYFKKTDGLSVNITRPFIGVPGQIPFFNSEGSIRDSAPLKWNDTTKQIRIGSSNVLTRFELVTTFNSQVDGKVAAEKILVKFDDRSTVANSVFSGLDIVLESFPKFDGSNFSEAGRLGQDEIAIGLNVDMTDLIANSGAGASTFTGHKFAAVFNGGLVGIGTSSPEGLLHVVEDEALQADSLFKVENSDNEVVFIVSRNGQVGVGRDDMKAQLHVKNLNAGQDIFRLDNSAGVSQFVVKESGNVGIGLSGPSEKLHVAGAVSANIGYFREVSTNLLTVGDNVFSLKSDGSMAIGTDNMNLASVFVYKELDETVTNPFTLEKLQVLIKGRESGLTESGEYIFNFRKDITGLDVNLSSNSATDILGDGSTTNTAKGINVDLTGTQIDTNATAYGMYVDVGNLPGTRYAAVFKGNVGISTSNPTHELVVSGSISAKGLILSGDLEAGDVTLNTMFSNGDVSINGGLQVDTLVADVVSANEILVLGEVNIETASFTFVTVNNRLLAANGGIGIVESDSRLNDYDFVVSGNSIFVGDVTIEDTLKVNEISSNEVVITVNNSMLVSGFVSASRVGAHSISFIPTDNTGTVLARGELFVKSGTEDLFYKKPGLRSSDANLLNLTSVYRGGGWTYSLL